MALTWDVVFAALGLTSDKVEEHLASLRSQYPDSAAFEQAVKEWYDVEVRPKIGQIPMVVLSELKALGETGQSVVTTDPTDTA